MLFLTAIVMQIGQEVITSKDIENFASFLALSHQQTFSSLPPHKKEDFKKKAFQELKRIEVQLKVAKAFLPSKKEVNKALTHLADQNHVQLSDMKSMFKKANIPWDLFEKRMKAQVAWIQYVRNRFGPLVVFKDEKVKSSSETEYELFEKTFSTYDEALRFKNVLLSHKTWGERRSLVLKESNNHGYLGWIKGSQLPNLSIPSFIGECEGPVMFHKKYRVFCLGDIKKPFKNPESTQKGTLLAITLPKETPKYLEYEFLKKQFYATSDTQKLQELARKMGGHAEVLEDTSFFSMNLSPSEIKKLIKAPLKTKIFFSSTLKGVPVEHMMIVLKKDDIKEKQISTIDWGDIKLSQLAERELEKHMKIIGVSA